MSKMTTISASNTTQKRILVIGGTGAQGFAVVKALLEGPNPYSVRVLSRNPDAQSVQKAFAGLPVEFVKGSFMDFDSVRRSLQDCYRVYVNTDGFTVKESDEIFAGIRIFEISNTIPTLRHFVYSSIDYYLQLTGFNHAYAAHHTNAKGRVNSYLQSQASSTSANGLTWSILNTGAYTEDLQGGFFTPKIRADGTRVFALPLGDGHLPLMTLHDNGVFARIVFDDRAAWSGKTLNMLSHFATGLELAETLEKVAGVKAVYEPISLEKWIRELAIADAPVATTDPQGITVGQNFAMWWPGFQTSQLKNLKTRDEVMLKKLHPGLQSLEEWMRETGYDGTPKPVLKGFIDAGVGPGF
jgi:hypothetical protein